VIDLNELAFFAAVAESGSFTQAAKQFDIPKSTLSRRVAKLENRLGVRLLYRSTRHIKLTEAGQLYVERCQRMLEEAQDAENIITNLRAEPSGLLRIGTPLGFGTTFFQSLIKEFLQQYPKVRIEIVMDDHPQDIFSENIDIAFQVGPLPDSSVVAKHIGTARLVFCATKTYINKHGKPTTPDELAEHLIIRHPDSRVITQRGRRDRHFDLSGGLLINDLELICKMTLRDAGIGLVHTLLVEEQLREGKLIPLLADYPCKPFDIFLLYPGRKQLPSKTATFKDFVLDRVVPIAPWEAW
jgi:DNA-binding transcriptional LysR family regulator